MAGAIVHILFGLFSAIIAWYKFRNSHYAISIFIGSLLHDIFIMAYAPFILHTLNPMEIIGTQLWFHRDFVFNILWITIQTLFIGLFLFFQKYVRKKEFKELEYNMGFLLIGMIIHALLDMFVAESGIWL